MTSSVDIVVAATDHLECQRQINEACLASETVAVYPSVWVDQHVEAAEVGEVLWVLPGRHTPCFRCYSAFRPDSGEAQPRGGTRPDIMVLVLVAVQVVAALLEPDTDRSRFLLDEEATLILVHSFMPVSPGVQEIFFDEPSLGTVRVPWPQIRCPACGGQAARAAAQRDSFEDRPLARGDPAARPATTREWSTDHRPNSLRQGHWRAALVVAAVVLVVVLVGIVGQTHNGSPSPTSISASTATTTTLPASVPPSTSPSPTVAAPSGIGTSFTSTGGGIAAYLYDSRYQVAVGSASASAWTLAVPIDASGPGDLRDPATSCLRIATPAGQVTLNALTVDLAVQQPGQHYEGNLIFPLAVPGTYDFLYSCQSDYSAVRLGGFPTMPWVSASTPMATMPLLSQPWRRTLEESGSGSSRSVPPTLIRRMARV